MSHTHTPREEMEGISFTNGPPKCNLSFQGQRFTLHHSPIPEHAFYSDLTRAHLLEKAHVRPSS